MRKTIVLGLLAGLFWASCSPSELSTEEYFKYLVDRENGLYQTKRINQFAVTARYLPAEYWVYRDYQAAELEKINIDSLKEAYKGNLTFMLQIAPNKAAGHEFDVMTQTVSSEKAYKQQAFQLNFLMQEHLKLKVQGEEYKPVLVELENTYELTPHRNFIVTYGLDKDILEEPFGRLDFIFHDKIFGTGIHHFLFEQTSITQTPSIKL